MKFGLFSLCALALLLFQSNSDLYPGKTAPPQVNFPAPCVNVQPPAGALLVLADPEMFPDAKRFPPRGWKKHCLIADNKKKIIRPFYENTMCRHEAEVAIGKFPDLQTPPIPRIN
jgi:hypothetical protein